MRPKLVIALGGISAKCDVGDSFWGLDSGQRERSNEDSDRGYGDSSGRSHRLS